MQRIDKLLHILVRYLLNHDYSSYGSWLAFQPL